MGIRMRTSYVAVLFASLVFAAACGDDDGVVEPATPTTLSIVDGEDQDGTTGFPLEQQLRVRVLSQDGDPMANVMVTWTVSGGGTLSDSSTLTNAAGEAVVSWTLGPAEGPQTVTATAPGTSPVTFTANASAVAPLFLAATAGNNQRGFALEPIGATRVVLLGSDRRPIPGATITWSVLTGGGSVNPTTSVTDANGQASTTWTLGPTQGAQTMQARAGNAVTVFTAIVDDPCTSARPFSALTAANRALGADDCLLSSGPRSGSFIEYFNFAPTTQQATQFTVTSTAVDTYLAILRGTDTVAFNNDIVGAGAGTNSKVNVIMAPGAYRIGVTSAVAAQTGAYTVTQAAMPTVTGCETNGRFFLTPGVTFTQSLQTTDCAAATINSEDDPSVIAWHDRYRIFLREGETVTITYEAPEPVDPVIVLFSPTGAFLELIDNGFPGDTEVLEDFTAPTTGFYILDTRTYRFNSDELGPYTITISPVS